MSNWLTRIAIVSFDRCKPKKCCQECKKSCPVVKTRKLCIDVSSAAKIAFISEELCIGCGICVKKCPFEAIQIINLPKAIDKDTTHRYGPSTFKLHRLGEGLAGGFIGLIPPARSIAEATVLQHLASTTYKKVAEKYLSNLIANQVVCTSTVSSWGIANATWSTTSQQVPSSTKITNYCILDRRSSLQLHRT